MCSRRSQESRGKLVQERFATRARRPSQEYVPVPGEGGSACLISTAVLSLVRWLEGTDGGGKGAMPRCAEGGLALAAASRHLVCDHVRSDIRRRASDQSRTQSRWKPPR